MGDAKPGTRQVERHQKLFAIRYDTVRYGAFRTYKSLLKSREKRLGCPEHNDFTNTVLLYIPSTYIPLFLQGSELLLFERLRSYLVLNKPFGPRTGSGTG